MKRKLNICFIYPTNRSRLIREVKNRLSPDNALYGLNHMHKFGFQASSADVYKAAEIFLDLIFTPLNWLFLSQIDIDFKLSRALLSAKKLNQDDVIVTNIDGIGLAVCFLKRLKIVKPPVIYAVGLFYIQGKLAKSINSGRETLFLRFYRWILQGADHIIYHSPIEKTKLIRLGLYNPARCTFISMGSDDKFFKNKRHIPSEDIILSVGKDRARDYETLFKAAEILPQYKFVVICREKNLANLRVPSNVKTIFEIPYQEVAKWYRKSKLLIIPIKEMHRSSGQMVLTDGMQCAKPIIISDVVGISHYKLRNKKEVLIVHPGNFRFLAKAIHIVMEDENLRRNLKKRIKSLAKIYTTKEYAKNLSKMIRKLSEVLQLSPLGEESLEFVRELRNKNKDFFLNGNYITKKDHKKWYRSVTKKGNEFNYLLKKNEENIGFSSIYNIDENKKTADVGRLMIQEKFRSQGYGKLVLRLLEEIAFGELMLTNLRLAVLKDNKTAYYLYKKEGYNIEEESIITGREVVIMTKTKLGKDV